MSIGGKAMVFILQGTYNPEITPPPTTGTRLMIDYLPTISQVLEPLGTRIPYIKSMFPYFIATLSIAECSIETQSSAGWDQVVYVWAASYQFWEPLGHYKDAVTNTGEVSWAMVNNMPTVYVLLVCLHFHIFSVLILTGSLD